MRRMPPDQMYEAIRIEGADQWSRAVALQTLSTWNGFDDMDESEIQWRKEEAEAKFAEMNAATEEREAVAAEATADKEELEAIEAEREYQQELREAEEAIEAAKREEQEAVEAMAKAELEEQEAIEAEKISIERGQDSEKAKLLMESKLIAAREAEDIAAMEEEEAVRRTQLSLLSLLLPWLCMCTAGASLARAHPCWHQLLAWDWPGRLSSNASLLAPTLPAVCSDKRSSPPLTRSRKRARPPRRKTAGL